MECSPFGGLNRIDITKYDGYKPGTEDKPCPQCKVIRSYDDFYILRSGKYTSYCKYCYRKRSSETLKDNKIRAIEYKGGCCIVCKYNRCNAALEFHHLDPSEKDLSIRLNSLTNWNKIQNELDKCVLVCANCHREIHQGMHGDVVGPVENDSTQPF